MTPWPSSLPIRHSPSPHRFFFLHCAYRASQEAGDTVNALGLRGRRAGEAESLNPFTPRSSPPPSRPATRLRLLLLLVILLCIVINIFFFVYDVLSLILVLVFVDVLVLVCVDVGRV